MFCYFPYLGESHHEILKNRTSIVVAHRLSTIKEVDKIIEIMQNSIKLEVPTLVDVEIGPSWGETYERKK